MLTRRPGTEVTEDFLRARVRAAWEYRKTTVDTSSCRVIFGEADWIPGIVVDKFSDILVIQSLSLGMDRFKDLILRALREAMAEDGIHIRGIYERSDAKVRELEGMERTKGFLSEPFDTKVEIVENGVRYEVDVENGQKYEVTQIPKWAYVFVALYVVNFFLIIGGGRSVGSARRGRLGACGCAGGEKCSPERTFGTGAFYGGGRVRSFAEAGGGGAEV